jgi:hypothetical protein
LLLQTPSLAAARTRTKQGRFAGLLLSIHHGQLIQIWHRLKNDAFTTTSRATLFLQTSPSKNLNQATRVQIALKRWNRKALDLFWVGAQLMEEKVFITQPGDENRSPISMLALVMLWIFYQDTLWRSAMLVPGATRKKKP